MLVLRHDEPGQTEFVFISLWETMEAIRGFAGEDVERARYYPEDRYFLLSLEPAVRHYVTTAALPATPGV